MVEIAHFVLWLAMACCLLKTWTSVFVTVAMSLLLLCLIELRLRELERALERDIGLRANAFVN